jgi:hypothetical protein
MSRKAILVGMLAVSLGLFGQRSGAPGGTGSTGSGSTGAAGSAAGSTAGSGTGTSAAQAGTPTTQGAVGGMSGQAAAGPINTPSANQAGSPTLPAAVAGPAGTTGSTQANPDTLNNGGTFNNGVNNGFVSNGATGPVLLSTPVVTFASPAPAAGISDAGRAGISVDMTANPGVQSTLENSTVVYTSGAPVYLSGTNSSGANASPAASGRLVNDMGPSYFSNTVGGGSSASLGEVAAQLKAQRGTANARMLTNDDVQKMVDSNTGVTVAKNMPPLGPGAAVQSGAAQGEASQSGTQMAQAGAATGQQAQPGSTGQQRAGTPPPVDSSQAQPAGSTATAGNSTTPQINQNQQSNDAQGRSRLPATSTLLPLFGLLGVVSGGLGLWFRNQKR